MKRLIYISLIFILFAMPALFSSEVIPRVVVVMYREGQERDYSLLNVHQLAEMPLNQLGIILRYHDITKGFPDIEHDPEVIGILSWFMNELSVPNPHEYIDWVERSVKAGKKFVMMGSLGFSTQQSGITASEVNHLWAALGLMTMQRTVGDTYRANIEINDKHIMNFERKYDGIKPMYEVVQPISPDVKILATAHYRGNSDNDSLVAALSPKGGYVMKDYSCYKELEGPYMQGMRGWYINPFEFFRRAFAYQDVPIPDTTTEAGRRLYYSQIDGDGWNNLTQLEKYRLNKAICAEVLDKEILSVYQDLPTTVGPIGADININWGGQQLSRDIAEKIFLHPHVEVGCHTFTHPFDWVFFKNYNPEKEVPYLTLYPHGSWKYKGLTGMMIETYQNLRDKNSLGGDVASVYQAGVKEEKPGGLALGYTVPRAFALEPFNPDLEVIGAIDQIDNLLDNKRKVKVIQWSGNCLVFEKIIKLSREAGVRNINGGDSRFDNEAFSYGWVKSIGRQVGQQQQIYASCSNENIYTSGWRERFWGQILLQQSFKNMETPIRVKPLNLYYHVFSAEKLSSLSALINNLEYIRKQSITPVTTSHFAAIGDGFYSTKIDKVGGNKWQIRNRGELQTIRFDRSSLKGIDFEASEGVIGQRHFQGSLYVYLDRIHQNPVIALKELDSSDEEPIEKQLYLIDSRWRVWGLKNDGNKLSMKAQGFGQGTMTWRVPENAEYKILVNQGSKVLDEGIAVAKGNNLTIDIKRDVSALASLTIEITKK